jgi:hypothetical protein
MKSADSMAAHVFSESEKELAIFWKDMLIADGYENVHMLKEKEGLGWEV